MKALPTLRQMQYLLALKETENFRRAAESCNVTQPTLSAGIQEMESILGIPVLDRSRKKHVIFTAFGEEVLKTANQIMMPLSNMMDQAQQMAKPLSGPLRLGAIPTIAPYMLPTLLPYLQKQFPNIDFQITEDITGNLIEKLHAGAIDMALMAFPFDTPKLNQKIFFSEPFHCASPKGTFDKKYQLKLSDIDQHKLLLLEDGHCLRDHALSACKLQAPEEKKSLSATSLLTLIQMAAQGYGITLLPDMVLKQGPLPKNIALNSFKKPMPTRKIGVAWRQKDPKSNTLNAVIDGMIKTTT